ncbi:MAG: TldD/PmbA family protein [Candidatus Thorarchaeota archaeon]
MKHLLELAEKANKAAEALGAQQVEVYVSSQRAFSIEVENSAIKTAVERRDAGCGVRSVVDKKIGFAYVTTIEEADILETAKKSVALAKASLPDPDFISMVSYSESYPIVKGLYDRSINDLSSEDAAGLIVRTIDATLEGIGGKQVAIEAQLAVSSTQRAILNSLGIAQTAESTSVMMYSYPTVKTDETQTASYEYQISRQLSEIDPEWIGEHAAKNVLRSLGAKTVEGGDMPVLFTPLAVGTVLGGGFAGAVNAEEVQYGRSYIADDFGSKIGSSELTIIDNGLLENGVGSRSFDGEGYPSQRTPILEKGVLKNLLHNSYTANKDNVDNTGNASRPSYTGIPGISTSNFVISEGSGSLDDLISEINKGILCVHTGDRPNMTTGDLSAMVSEGYYIENGAIKHPVKTTLIGINMRDLLQRVHRIGADTRTTFSVTSPSIVVESAKVTSG